MKIFYNNTKQKLNDVNNLIKQLNYSVFNIIKIKLTIRNDGVFLINI